MPQPITGSGPANRQSCTKSMWEGPAIFWNGLAPGLSRVVYTSSVGTLGNRGNGLPGDETTPVTFADMVGHYKKSKFLAEREAESFLGARGPTCHRQPIHSRGILDIKPTPTGKIIVDFLNRRMPAYLDTGFNVIDVEDCARGHLLAAQVETASERDMCSVTKT